MADRSDDDGDWIAHALTPTADPDWVLTESGYDPTREAGIEARFAVGNGFLGVRGSRSVSRGPTWTTWQHTLTWASWPRTYIAGLFDTPNTEPPVPALVPGHDWLRSRLWIDGESLLLRFGQVLDHRRQLDMRRGMLITSWRQLLPSGRTVRVRTLRFASQADRALGGQMLWLETDGGPAAVRLEASFESIGSALEHVASEPGLELWRTAQSGKALAAAGWAELTVDGHALPAAMPEPLRWSWTWTAMPGQPAVLKRLAAFVRADEPRDDPRRSARAALDRAGTAGWRATLEAHERAWAERWRDSDVAVDGDADAQRALRFAVYHMISTANPDDERVSVGARALTGDAYLGHVFWDTEIYLLPFYTLTWPAAARAMLMYRLHTIDGARRKAARLGCRGAAWAWESADTGDETTPERVIDPNGRVIDVLCGLQEWHITADIAYAVVRYWEITGDDAFLREAGAEMLLEAARFWASCARLEDDARYHIRGVIGPDEYHESIDDNAYTNEMARWTIERASAIIDVLNDRWPDACASLITRLDLTDAERAQWRDVAARLATSFDPATGLFEQFAGYFALEDIDLAPFAGRTVPMDVVLGRERTQASQVVKQADVIALLALLPDRFDAGVHRANYRYYEPRCGHGSSLSRAMHAVAAARLGDIEQAALYFRQTAETDLGPTTVASAGGIRIAAQGGLWQAAIFGFAGVSAQADALVLAPALPPGWRSMTFRLRWRGRRLLLHIGRARLTATLEDGAAMPLRLGDRTFTLQPGEPIEPDTDPPAS
jgi:trehalose/maltose hydrolase-like predicted phosphorylase